MIDDRLRPLVERVWNYHRLDHDLVRSDAIPYWALRRRVETRVRGKANTSEEERVVGVEEKLRAAAQDFVCTIVEVVGPHGSHVRVRSSDMRPHSGLGLIRMAEQAMLGNLGGGGQS